MREAETTVEMQTIVVVLLCLVLLATIHHRNNIPNNNTIWSPELNCNINVHSNNSCNRV